MFRAKADSKSSLDSFKIRFIFETSSQNIVFSQSRHNACKVKVFKVLRVAIIQVAIIWMRANLWINCYLLYFCIHYVCSLNLGIMILGLEKNSCDLKGPFLLTLYSNYDASESSLANYFFIKKVFSSNRRQVRIVFYQIVEERRHFIGWSSPRTYLAVLSMAFRMNEHFTYLLIIGYIACLFPRRLKIRARTAMIYFDNSLLNMQIEILRGVSICKDLAQSMMRHAWTKPTPSKKPAPVSHWLMQPMIILLHVHR